MVPLGLLLAAAASFFVLLTLGLERITGALHERATDDDLNAMFDLLDQGLVFSSGLSIIPALPVVFICGVARIRSRLLYLACG